jgi:hypothetical protein
MALRSGCSSRTSGRALLQCISFGAGYKEAHERLERSGSIDHKWSDCQEQKHPATARVWDETHGWREIQIPWVHWKLKTQNFLPGQCNLFSNIFPSPAITYKKQPPENP